MFLASPHLTTIPPFLLLFPYPGCIALALAIVHSPFTLWHSCGPFYCSGCCGDLPISPSSGSIALEACEGLLSVSHTQTLIWYATGAPMYGSSRWFCWFWLVSSFRLMWGSHACLCTTYPMCNHVSCAYLSYFSVLLLCPRFRSTCIHDSEFLQVCIL